MSNDGQDELTIGNYGEKLPYDRNFRGPKWRNRTCTDVPCLLIFLVFLAGWGFVAQYAVKNGDLNKLLVPTDSLNQKCGLDSAVLDKKYLFFFDLQKCLDPLVPITGCPTPQVCVASCPSQTFHFESMKTKLSLAELKSRMICLTDADKNNINKVEDAEKAIKLNRCAGYYIKSSPVLNRCMWEISDQVCTYIPSFMQRQTRSLMEIVGKNDTLSSELPLQALALIGAAQQRVATQPQSPSSVQEEPIVKCRDRTELGVTVIKSKMMQTNTRLAKFVGAFVSQFYNGTHDAQQLGEEIVEDVINSWFVVLMALLGTLVASLILIALMRWLASPITWISIFGVLVGLLVAIYYSIKEYKFWSNHPRVPDHSWSLNSTVKNILEETNTWLYLSIFLGVCFVIILLLVIVLRKRIVIAIALTQEGSKAVSSVISTVFFPIFSWLLLIAAIVFAVTVGLYLGSIGEPTYRMIQQLDRNSQTGVTNEKCICEGPAINYTVGLKCEPPVFQQNCFKSGDTLLGFFGQSQRSPCTHTSCSFLKIEHTPLVKWFIACNIFGYFWLSFFISAFNDMVLAATFATWYWTFKKKDVPYFTLTRALRQTAFYHLGTLAFGSLILAICRIIRVILEYIDRKLKMYDNVVTRSILCCMRCFFWLLENFLRFLNRNAYIMCAIHGKNFCSSAQDAFNLIMRNFLRVIALDKVTDFLFFLSKVLLTASAGTATYYFLASHPHIVYLHYKAVPTTVVVIAAYLITSVFFSVYSMAVDTLFLCFLEDCERNNGTPEMPYYMSKGLMSILGKRNKIPKRTNK